MQFKVLTGLNREGVRQPVALHGLMERVTGIEPASFGWEPKALPLSYTRDAQHSMLRVAVRQTYYSD